MNSEELQKVLDELEALRSSRKRAWENLQELRRGRKMRFKVVIAVLCALTILSSVYAFRQRQWALKLRDQLAETNKDDVKLMNMLSGAEKETICRKFREHGEPRIADWITRQYLVTQEADETLISQDAEL
jgi:hypothetical protein